MSCSMNKPYFVERLKDLSISQRQLAKRLDLDPASVSYLLSGKRQLKAVEVKPLADILRVSPTDVLDNLGKL